MKQKMNTYQNDVKEYEVEEKTLNNKTYISVPVTMMVEGVHQGSHGALLHTAEELGKIPASWNGIPVTIGHPTVDGVPVSANSPEILEKWACGIVFNTNMYDFRLKSEAWFDKDKLKTMNENLYDRINNGEQIEVSVGVFSEDELEEGTWHNEPYYAIARNLRPDHLAILPNAVGACSLTDGCGIRTNTQNMKKDKKGRLEILQQLKQEGYIISELSVNESLLKLVEKVRSKVYALDSDVAWYYVEDIYDNYLIYSKSGRDIETKLYKQAYAIAADDSVTFIGDPLEVEKKVEYETVNNNEDTVVKRKRKINSNKEESIMSNEKCTDCVKKKVNALIANTLTSYEEADREWLEALDEVQLNKMEPKVVDPEEVDKGKKVVNNETPITPEMAVNALQAGLKGQDDFLNLMPKNMQEQMRSALKLHEDHKTSLIDGIVANSEGVWTKEELQTYEVEKLEKIAKTAGVKQVVFQPSYAGMGAGSTLNTNKKATAPAMYPMGVTVNEQK